MSAKWEVHDVLGQGELRRQISEVRDTGYTWFYPDMPDKLFLSEDSSDPWLETRWELVCRGYGPDEDGKYRAQDPYAAEINGDYDAVIETDTAEELYNAVSAACDEI